MKDNMDEHGYGEGSQSLDKLRDEGWVIEFEEGSMTKGTESKDSH